MICALTSVRRSVEPRIKIQFNSRCCQRGRAGTHCSSYYCTRNLISSTLRVQRWRPLFPRLCSAGAPLVLCFSRLGQSFSGRPLSTC